jgi:hypothetical protein
MLARFEGTAGAIAAAAIGLAWVGPWGSGRLAAGVAGGAALSGASYWAIKRGVTGLTDAAAAGAMRRTPRGFFAFVVRYALLAGMAYVMIARLRLHPLGLLGGATVIPLAAVIEAFRPRT